MRKAILLLIPLLIWGCEKTYDNVIDTSVQNYQVSMTNPSEIVIFNSSDSLIVVQIIFTPQSEISSVDFDIISPDGSKLNTSPIFLYDNGNLEHGDTLANDKNYANKFPMSEFFLNGNYKIQYYVLQLNASRSQVAIGTFYYFNGQDNVPPVISNNVVDPDTVVVTQPTAIFTSVEATDLNGSADILEVYFKVIRPDGTTNNNKVQLFDNGNISNGDEVAGDGIYSRLIQIDQNNQKGTYKFEFRAKDRSDAFSNIINHYVLIQ